MYLQLKNLSKVYNKKVTAVDDFSLVVNRGEFVAFLGPSGCGKSSTLRMIAGLESVTEGDIVLDGESIVHKEPRDRHISMIFQSYAVWPHMTVFENIAYPLKLAKIPKDQIKRTVHEVAAISDITEYLDRFPSQLSGGQRQRVAVARAIAVKPKLFLMDEPLSNLDAKLRVSMRSELKRIHEELNTTSIFVTHDQAEALSMADRIVVMNQGVVEQIGTPNEIYHDSATMFIAKFIGAPPANFFDVTVELRDKAIWLVQEHFSIQAPKELTSVLQQDYLGKTVVFAIRPEQIKVDEGDVDAYVDIVEPQGSHVIINAMLSDIPFKIVTSKIDVVPKTTLKLNFDSVYSLYDKATEKKIRG
jgi:multiple sugar transport system ATP-binding protein